MNWFNDGLIVLIFLDRGSLEEVSEMEPNENSVDEKESAALLALPLENEVLTKPKPAYLISIPFINTPIIQSASILVGGKQNGKF